MSQILKAAAVALLLVCVLAGCAAPVGMPAAAPSAAPGETATGADAGEVATRGSPDAPVVLAIFCDFV